MKLRTPTQIQDRLDEEFAWRLHELQQMKASVRSSTSLHRDVLLRAGVPLVYAHWEGFVKSSSEALLNFVANQRRSYRELQPCFALHGLASQMAILGEAKKHDRRLAALTFLLERLDDRASFPWKGSINTRANLNSEVFESIAAAIGIDAAKYRPRYNLIDLELLKRRNHIAHGDWLDIEDASFRTLADETIVLMRWFKTDLENSVVLGSYLR